jgi:putative (di)nucleoside polyphosphate hydrolase
MKKSANAVGAKPYRRGVGIALMDARGRVFVAQRIDTKESAWQMPQGGIDKGETPRKAAMRELLEEIGTDKARIIAATRGWLRYDLPEDLRGKVWNGKYRGQQQKWFLMEFLGTDADINIDTIHPEFSSWKWLPFMRLPGVIVGFKREIYKQVAEVFGGKATELAKTSKLATPRRKRARAPKHR